MPRTYSQEFINQVKQQDPNESGIALAQACVGANLPAKYVAVALKVTRMTVYSWFRGKPIRDKNRKLVEVFTDLVESDTAKGMLPARNTLEAKAYIEEMIGQKI
jgi:hypothetical protein|tara:strand:+ start:26 stop:337 length:312 start_codon:yes stop_codon:yes gene_type:complete